MPHSASLNFRHRLDPRLVTGAVDDLSAIAVATLGGAALNSASLERLHTLSGRRRQKPVGGGVDDGDDAGCRQRTIRSVLTLSRAMVAGGWLATAVVALAAFGFFVL